MSSFSHWPVKGFSSKRIALKVDVLQDRKIDCLQARPSIFQPGNFTGCGGEGVKYSPSLISLVVSVDTKHHVYLLTYLLQGAGPKQLHVLVESRRCTHTMPVNMWMSYFCATHNSPHRTHPHVPHRTEDTTNGSSHQPTHSTVTCITSPHQTRVCG